MKKVILAFTLILALSMMLTSCSSTKEAISPADFVSAAAKQSYVTEDLTHTFDTPLVENVTIAVPASRSYQIEFFTLTDEATASQLYTENKAALESAQGSNASSSERSGKNYARYIQKSGGMYSAVYYIGNTMLYASTDLAHEDAVQAFFSSVGY